jgi:hypothetical protein
MRTFLGTAEEISGNNVTILIDFERYSNKGYSFPIPKRVTLDYQQTFSNKPNKQGKYPLLTEIPRKGMSIRVSEQTLRSAGPLDDSELAELLNEDSNEENNNSDELTVVLPD